MTFRTEWTAERDAELRRLFDKDLSFSAIGQRMGISKNAVIGRARRLKLRRVKAAPSPSDPTIRSFSPVELRRYLQEVQHLPLPRTCAFPFGSRVPYTFCGKPTAGGSWCEEHRAIVYVPRKGAEA